VSGAPNIPGATRALRGPVDRLTLVEYVRDTPALQEKDWLEWKRGYDLTRKQGRVSTAKHLIGFANREPATASQTSEGYAYLLLGVEAGGAPGMPILDSADIENGIRPFVGDDLRFDIDYVATDGVHVLVFTVDPPQPGDPIHCLQQTSEDAETGKTLREGTVYVRKAGKTEQATAADIARLTERARRAGTALALDLAVVELPQALPAGALEDATRDRVVGEIRQKLMKSLPHAVGYGLNLPPLGETRSHDEFTREVDRFVKEATQHWQMYAAVEILERDPHPLRLELRNDTEHNYADVVVELRIPIPRDFVHLSVWDARQHLSPPEPPKRYGTNALASISPRINPAIFRGKEASDQVAGDNSGATVQFAPIHVRPHTPHALPDVFLILGPTLQGTDIAISWRATSSSTSGQMSGTITIAVG
jgi:hypothetical protein